MTDTKRKGARSTKDIPADILEQLNSGEIETANLVEWLAIDQTILLKNLLRKYNREHYLEPILSNVENLKKQTVNTINEAIGTALFELSISNNDEEILSIISIHKADVVRCWATYTIGKNQNLGIEETLEKIKIFAADKHFGVREISWLAIRPKILKHLEKSLAILSQWTNDDDENVRRFSTEATRPRGVWSEHIEQLKQNPEIASPILEKLKSDKSKYVQDSVGNWLNDASKTQAKFVEELCRKWLQESNTKETNYIVKRALRTIDKAKS